MSKHLLNLLLILLSFNLYADDDFPELEDFWVRAAPPGSMMQAAYGTLTNNTEEDFVLIDAYSPAFKMTELHKSIVEDGVAKMIHQPKLVIKAGEQLVFKPGSYHVMLMHPVIKFGVGDSIKINLVYKDGDDKKVQEIWFPVERK